MIFIGRDGSPSCPLSHDCGAPGGRALPFRPRFSFVRHDQRAQLERAATIRLTPEELVGRGQHLGDLEFVPFRQPAMENLQEQIALKIDKYWLGILVAALGAAATQRLLGWANKNKPRQISFAAQALDRDDEVARDAGEITAAEFVVTHDPGDRKSVV